MTLEELRRILEISVGKDITGLKGAKKLMNGKMAKEVPVLIEGLDASNLFSQHDGDLIRYDRQDSSAKVSNFQIQLGGKDKTVLRAGKGGTSVTAVVDDVAIQKKLDNSAEDLGHFVTIMREAHTTSFETGKVVHIKSIG